MKIRKIRIQKLFGLFNYDIELNQNEDLTILTGPNGYGKTTILNIIYNLFNQRFFYFQKLNFELISFSFDTEKRIEVKKMKGK
jgi:predicted ATP-binding protein involved in virulence